jgi:hypothetical protein
MMRIGFFQENGIFLSLDKLCNKEFPISNSHSIISNKLWTNKGKLKDQSMEDKKCIASISRNTLKEEINCDI